MLRVARFPHSLNTTVVATQQVPTEHGSGRSPTTKLHLNGVLSWALSYHHGIQVIGHFWWKPRWKGNDTDIFGNQLWNGLDIWVPQFSERSISLEEVWVLLSGFRTLPCSLRGLRKLFMTKTWFIRYFYIILISASASHPMPTTKSKNTHHTYHIIPVTFKHTWFIMISRLLPSLGSSWKAP